jgi:hypothetical protein
MVDCRAIAMILQQEEACFEAKAVPGKKPLAFCTHLKEINARKRKLKPDKIANIKKKIAQFPIPT